MALFSSPDAGHPAASENFPVASWLIAARHRPVVAAYYRFARAADDIADDPNLDGHAKLRQLGELDLLLSAEAPRAAASTAEQYALDVRALLVAQQVPIEHARHLLQAFRADAANRPCRGWSDLLAYCRYSAAPVGRFLLDLHGEDRATWNAGDALCAALQILNHLQDCQADWRDLQRLYIPRDWFDEAGLTPDALLGVSASAPLRAVFDRLLVGVDRLNATAASLPRQIADRRLRTEVTAILMLSKRLALRLHRKDPLARRIKVTFFDKALALACGAIGGLVR
jgi:squalene synthase HpnC